MARLNSPPRLDFRWRHVIDDHVIALGWSPDRSTVAAASVSGPVALLETQSGAPRHTLPGHGFGTTALAWRPDGKTLATAGQDGKARLWDPATGKELAALDAGAAWVERLAWGPKGDFLVSAAGKKLRLWSPDGTLVKTYADAASTIADVVWSPRGKEFVTGGFGGVTFYRPDADGPVNRFEWKGSLLALAWSPDGKMLAGGGQDSSVHFWYVKTGEDLEMGGYPMKVRELAWDATSQFLATGGGEVVIVWDCSGDGPAGSKPLTFELHEKPIAALAFQRRGPVLASGAADGKVALWYPGGSKKVQATADFGEGVSQLAWSPGDGRLAVGGEGGVVAVYAV
ncbi:MAG TPA: WD40 repeat domain-containing protein [Gemmataceae bacterium]|jgi:WD40 repeat protein|nr:WD40 repeat domain-containing protein [Gemmataceae bacterium]